MCDNDISVNEMIVNNCINNESLYQEQEKICFEICTKKQKADERQF